MSFWCKNFFQKKNEIFSRISALTSKMRSNQKNKGTLYQQLEDFILTLTLIFWFDLFLEARAEFLEKNSLVFWKKFWYQKDILKLTDL